MRAVLGLIAAAALASSASAAEPIDPAIAVQFATPHQLVEVAKGRRLNLLCMGSGERTVLFDAGGSDWSVVWALVQPAIAKKARACVYDRAGLGHSDPSPDPRSPFAIVEDAHALIAAAIKGPVVLVGHSLGGFHAKLHAALYPDEVAALVLVDPAEERWWERTRAATAERFGPTLTARSELIDQNFMSRLTARYRECAAAARPAGLDPKSVTYRRCTDPPRPQLGGAIAAERERLQAKAVYQEAQASEIANSVYANREADPAYAGLFRPGLLGDKPVIVLTNSRFDPDDPLDQLGNFQGVMLHRQTAALSRRGIQRSVPGTGHYIELEAPEAVIASINEALAMLGGAPGQGEKVR